MEACGGPTARLPEHIGRKPAFEVLLSSEDIRAGQAEASGYVNRALPDADVRRGALDPDLHCGQVGGRQHQASRQPGHTPALRFGTLNFRCERDE